ncbi:MAG: hypothetical protein RLZZ165_1008 [Bacteroidota bacterium]
MKFALKITMFILSLAVAVPSSAQLTRQLDIPPRLQWDNDGGYCGETSIQSFALYYGNYISQDFCRKVAGGEVLIGDENGEVALDAFSFTMDTWDYNRPPPQYQDHLVWIKSHIARNHPVIITLYLQGENSPEYDHIVPAFGYSSQDTTAYHGSDQLMFNDNFVDTPYTRTFESIWDDRALSGNGATYDYCIPKDYNYACAVTGIKDDAEETLPLHLSVNRWDEPNVSLGESPVLLTGTLVAESLQTGGRYVLLRYDSYLKVPSSGFNPGGADTAIYFTAAGPTYTTTATFMSNAAVFFRCVPDIFSAADPSSQPSRMETAVYPNPAHDLLTVSSPANAVIEILGADAKVVMSKTYRKPKNTMDIGDLPCGTYLLRIRAEGGVTCRRFIKD